MWKRCSLVCFTVLVLAYVTLYWQTDPHKNNYCSENECTEHYKIKYSKKGASQASL